MWPAGNHTFNTEEVCCNNMIERHGFITVRQSKSLATKLLSPVQP